MHKTILLVFVHGFKGDDVTFGDFPEHFRTMLSNKYPHVTVAKAVYPKYETRGSLNECVGKLREWLQDKVIDIEVANENHSPTIDSSVYVILVGHSMGGIVGADLLIQLANEKPVTGKLPDGMKPANTMFPKIKGLIAFDTPFLGISPGVLSYSAEGHYQTASSTYNTISGVANRLGLGSSSSKPKNPAADDPTSDNAAVSGWGKMGKYAMYAGALGTVAAAGAAAYANRQNITESLGWASSHLEFVGCLTQPRVLEKRLNDLADLPERKIGSVNFFTCLGTGAKELVTDSDANQSPFARRIVRPTQRTFCTLPRDVENNVEQKIAALQWIKATNNQASDEIMAHTTMFMPKKNPGYQEMLQSACVAAEIFIDTPWYSSSSPLKQKKLSKADQSAEGDDFVFVSHRR
ncbi:uncharacterized protein N7483_003471 [Penicillium malachiteum]|uniref:uncharacterized protein n=1 Tax=Penicillium malachiteum TaxID=1324776 RepID=UPI002546C666|nr:uncharacterized protein N7483_003471 [Penicillium malachiteum]KAJ5728963.1 hypothetical protein N7483_003471 [Penicillium malachiteum]